MKPEKIRIISQSVKQFTGFPNDVFLSDFFPNCNQQNYV